MARRQGLFGPRRRRKRYGCLAVVFLLLISLGVMIGLNSLSNRFVKLEIQALTLPDLPRALEGFAILHLSDLNAATLGSNHEHLRKALEGESYGAVCLTGDMVGKGGNAQPMIKLLDVIGDKVPVILIAGAGDPAPLLSFPRGDAEVLAPYIREAQARGAVYLDRPVMMEEDGARIWFCPADTFELDLLSAQRAYQDRLNQLNTGDNPASPENAAQIRLVEYQLKMLEDSAAARAEMKPEDIIVALRHHPPETRLLDELREAAEGTAAPLPDVYLSGQYNNGQARLPGLGPIYLPPQADGRGGWLPGDQGLSGLNYVKGQAVYISPGLGVSSYYPIPIRLFNRPAATLIQLTSRLR
ncbi:MAG: metallophosphoesterase [Eubacteriales bacterium]|nr:metallophosphoesterase [Eubacteriales bacterium]